MAKRLVWTAQAKNDLRSMDQAVALQILRTLARYVTSGEATPSNSKASIRRWFAYARKITAFSFATKATTWRFLAC
jgi:hypothetical protein